MLHLIFDKFMGFTQEPIKTFSKDNRILDSLSASNVRDECSEECAEHQFIHKWLPFKNLSVLAVKISRHHDLFDVIV